MASFMFKSMQTISNRLQIPAEGSQTGTADPGRLPFGCVRLLLLVAVSAGVAGTCAPLVTGWIGSSLGALSTPAADATSALIALCVLAASVLGAWLWLLWVWEAILVLRLHGQGASGRALVPVRGLRAIARRLAVLLLGLSAVGGVGASSALAQMPITVQSITHLAPSPTQQGPEALAAAGGEIAQRAQGTAAVEIATSPGWRPTRPTVRVQPDPGFRPVVDRGGASTEVRGEVVVHRGDSLWSIAAAQLGAGATDDEIAEAWPRWYATNRAIIGADPDRLLPGQVLQIPTQTDGDPK